MPSAQDEAACSHFFISNPWKLSEEVCLYCPETRAAVVAPADVIVPWVAPPPVRIVPALAPSIDWRARHARLRGR